MENLSQFQGVDKLDYWFLDIALEMPVAINDLVPDRQGFLGINRKPLDLSLLQMTKILDKLFKEGYLCASKLYNLAEGVTPGKLVTFIPNESEIFLGLKRAESPEIINNGDSTIEIYDNLFNFFLTSKGGSAWESLSNPQWEIYFDKRTRYSKYENVGESWIYCSNKKTIEQIVSIEHLLDHGNLNHEVISNTKKCKSISPFILPYWRTSPSGYELYYKFKYTEYLDNDSEDDNKPLDYIKKRDEARMWYKNICRNWYDNYFKFA